jgi:tetratricopeptide (TPR) repeat protein
LREKFRRLGDIDLLNRSISAIEDAVALTPDEDPNISKRLFTFALSLQHRYRVLNATADLEKAISVSARSLRPTPGVAIEWYTLRGELLHEKFKGTGRIQDLDDAISVYSEALGFTDGTRRTLRLRNLAAIGKLLGIRFHKLEEMSDLDNAISRWEEAVAISVDEKEIRADILTQLGQDLCMRFKWLQVEDDIHQAVSVMEQAISLRSEDDPERPTALFILGGILREQFIQTRDPVHLEQSILLSRQAVDRVTENDSRRSHIFSNLGSCLHKRYEHQGSLVDIDEAILMTRKGIECIPDGNSDVKAHLLNQLAWSLLARYLSLSAPEDIKSSIAAGSEAVLPDAFG